MADEPGKVRQIAVKLEHHWGDNTSTRFANEFSLQVSQGVYYLSFYEAVPPLFIGPQEEIVKQIESMKSVRAEGIVRLVVATEKLVEIMHVIQSALGRVADEKSSGTEDKEVQK